MSTVRVKMNEDGALGQAIQLKWDNWAEICEEIGVGRLLEGKPEGTYIDTDGRPNPSFATSMIGVLFPTQLGVMVAYEGDWFVKMDRLSEGHLYILDKIFDSNFTVVEEEPVSEPKEAPGDVFVGKEWCGILSVCEVEGLSAPGALLKFGQSEGPNCAQSFTKKDLHDMADYLHDLADSLGNKS